MFILLFQKLLVWKLKRIFGEKRRKTNQQYADKGGRPVKVVVDKRPGSKCSGTLLCDTISTLTTLFVATFQGRRKEFMDGKLIGVQTTLTTACPVLNQLYYVKIFHIYTLS